MFHCNIISPPPNNADGDMQYRSSPVRQISVSIYDSPLTTKKSVPHTSSIDSETGSDVVHNVMIVPIPIIPTTYPSIITPAGVVSPTTTLSLAGLTDTPSATVIPPITTVSHSATNAGFYIPRHPDSINIHTSSVSSTFPHMPPVHLPTPTSQTSAVPITPVTSTLPHVPLTHSQSASTSGYTLHHSFKNSGQKFNIHGGPIKTTFSC